MFDITLKCSKLIWNILSYCRTFTFVVEHSLVWWNKLFVYCNVKATSIRNRKDSFSTVTKLPHYRNDEVLVPYKNVYNVAKAKLRNRLKSITKIKWERKREACSCASGFFVRRDKRIGFSSSVVNLSSFVYAWVVIFLCILALKISLDYV